jgi:hypothetical protein
VIASDHQAQIIRLRSSGSHHRCHHFVPPQKRDMTVSKCRSARMHQTVTEVTSDHFKNKRPLYGWLILTKVLSSQKTLENGWIAKQVRVQYADQCCKERGDACSCKRGVWHLNSQERSFMRSEQVALIPVLQEQAVNNNAAALRDMLKVCRCPITKVQ